MREAWRHYWDREMTIYWIGFVIGFWVGVVQMLCFGKALMHLINN
jgi:hypothetical protein